MKADQAYMQYRRQVFAIKRDWPSRIQVLQQASVSAYSLLGLLDAYRGIMTNLDTWSAVVGIADVAKAAEQNSGYDVVAGYQTLRSAIITGINRIAAMVPQPGGFCAVESMEAAPNLQTTGLRTARTFTTAQAAPAVTDAQAVIAAANQIPTDD